MILLYILASFLFGAIPSGFIVTKIAKGVDIRKFGSGNPGATNVFRVVGPAGGITVFILDCLKGFLPVALAGYFFIDLNSFYLLLAGLAAIAGHMFTPFLGFKGGKGVATGTGVFLALLPVITLFGALVFAVIFAFTRYVSLSSMCAGVFVPIASWASGQPLEISIFTTLTAILIIYAHRSNIQRLLNGTENRFKKQ